LAGENVVTSDPFALLCPSAPASSSTPIKLKTAKQERPLRYRKWRFKDERHMKTILVVEDEPDSASFIAATLQHAGYKVRVSRSRDFAMYALRKIDCGGIILDYYMPGMSAFEFLRNIHEKFALPVILVTCAYQPDDVAEVLGIQHCLPKPFHPEELITVVRNAFSETLEDNRVPS
jgi:CheY-like chemotaxis protein